ncbi:MAG: DDE-type integrase/transposase/recombinase [Paraglaciecola sp.]|nr:DDE-type integrase/transposase/recombinase [Paraglaciecola sp.]
MSLLALRNKAQFEFKGCKGTIDHVSERYVVLDFNDIGIKTLSPFELQDAYENGEFKIIKTEPIHLLSNITDPVMSEEFKFIQAVVTYMHNSPLPQSLKTISEAIAIAVSKYGMFKGSEPSISSVKRWYSKWIKNSKSVSFILKKSKEKRRSQFAHISQEIADEIIDREYLQRSGPTVQHAYERYCTAFEKEMANLERQNRQDNCLTGEIVKPKRMGRSTFYKCVDRLDQFEVDKARLGVLAAHKRHRLMKGSIITCRPLERVEIDAVHLNIALKQEQEDGSTIYYRPIIFLGIDVHTRLIVGYVITYSEGKPGETADAVVELMKQICNPFKKAKFSNTMFPLGGKPESIVSDSGPAFIATTVQMMMQSCAITHHVTQKASPWRKPFIERLIGTLKMQCMQTIAGYAGPRTRGVEMDNTLEQMAEYSVEEFEERVESYILFGYHNNSHRGLNKMSPLEFWEQEKDKCPPLIACSFDEYAKFRGQRLDRTITSPKGITINGVDYNNKETQDLGHKLKRENKNKSDACKVEVLYSAFDISEITIIDPFNQHFICVPAITNGATTKVALVDFKAAKRHGGNTNKNNTFSMSCSHTKKKTKTNRVKNSKNQSDATDIMTKMTEEQLDNTFIAGIGKHANINTIPPESSEASNAPEEDSNNGFTPSFSPQI